MGGGGGGAIERKEQHWFQNSNNFDKPNQLKCHLLQAYAAPAGVHLASSRPSHGSPEKGSQQGFVWLFSENVLLDH